MIFVWPWKMVSVNVRYLFYQPMDEKIKTWPLRFPAKENPNMEKALFDWPIVFQYDVKAKYRLISRKLSGMKLFHPRVRLTNQKPCAFVPVRWTNQIALFPFVSCFCFISRPYENRTICSTIAPSNCSCINDWVRYDSEGGILKHQISKLFFA